MGRRRSGRKKVNAVSPISISIEPQDKKQSAEISESVSKSDEKSLNNTQETEKKQESKSNTKPTNTDSNKTYHSFAELRSLVDGMDVDDIEIVDNTNIESDIETKHNENVQPQRRSGITLIEVYDPEEEERIRQSLKNNTEQSKAEKANFGIDIADVNAGRKSFIFVEEVNENNKAEEIVNQKNNNSQENSDKKDTDKKDADKKDADKKDAQKVVKKEKWEEIKQEPVEIENQKPVEIKQEPVETKSQETSEIKQNAVRTKNQKLDKVEQELVKTKNLKPSEVNQEFAKTENQESIKLVSKKLDEIVSHTNQSKKKHSKPLLKRITIKQSTVNEQQVSSAKNIEEESKPVIVKEQVQEQIEEQVNESAINIPDNVDEGSFEINKASVQQDIVESIRDSIHVNPIPSQLEKQLTKDYTKGTIGRMIRKKALKTKKNEPLVMAKDNEEVSAEIIEQHQTVETIIKHQQVTETVANKQIEPQPREQKESVTNVTVDVEPLAKQIKEQIDNSAEIKKVNDVVNESQTTVSGPVLTHNKIKKPSNKRTSLVFTDRAKVQTNKKDKYADMIDAFIKKSVTNRFKPIDEAYINCIEKPKFGLDMCIDSILQDYINTGYDWLYDWLTTTGDRKLQSITGLLDSSTVIINKDITTKCLMNIIIYISSKMHLEGVKEVDTILEDNGMRFRILNMDAHVHVYNVEIGEEILSDCGKDNSKLFKYVCETAIKMQYLYLTKKYTRSLERILEQLNNLPQKDELMFLTGGQIESIPLVVDEKSLFFRSIPKYFYDRFVQYKSIYRYLDLNDYKSCYINFVRRAAKNISSAVHYLNTVMSGSKNVFDIFYDGELELIYRYLYDKVIGSSSEYKNILTEDIMRELYVSGKTPKSIPDVVKLPGNDEEKVVYINCLLKLIGE